MNNEEIGEFIEEVVDKKPQSFIVEVEYCRNASWEGTVKWINGERVQHFRSEMELIALIQDAVHSCKL